MDGLYGGRLRGTHARKGMGDKCMTNRSLPEGIDSRLTRRRVLAAGAGLLATGGGIAVATRSSNAEVSMGELDVSGDSATVSEPPGEITIGVSGDYAINGHTPPEQARTILQIEVDGTSDDLDESVFMDAVTEGSYSLSANLYGHRNVERGSLLPEGNGETSSVELTIRVILLAVSGGEIQTETFVEDTATLELTKDGMSLSVGGSGEVSVRSAD